MIFSCKVSWYVFPCPDAAHLSGEPFPTTPWYQLSLLGVTCRVDILRFGMLVHKQQVSTFTYSKLPIKFFSVCRLWRAIRFFIWQSTCLVVVTCPISVMNFPLLWKGRDFPSLLWAFTHERVPQCGQDGLPSDGSILEFWIPLTLQKTGFAAQPFPQTSSPYPAKFSWGNSTCKMCK